MKRIIISRTDSIGDVVLTLPMCGALKKKFPGIQILFIGRTYTGPIIRCCKYVDEFIDWDASKDKSPQEQIDILKNLHADCIVHVFPRKELLWLAKRAGIPMRIATGRRLQTITKVNKLVFFTRKNSALHEAQLNFKLLKPLGIDVIPSLEEITLNYGLKPKGLLRKEISELIQHDKLNIILHPKSKGSAVEWGVANFAKLTALLPVDKTRIFITGTAAEGEAIRRECDLRTLPVVDLTGQLTLDELIAFIDACDVLVAASTGPLHIAAALGKKAIGLYTPKRPMHAGRWAPLGKYARVLIAKQHPQKGEFLDISPSDVVHAILQ
ncbi:MAG: glycosyltransferase family 9 protein [Flavobacteriales bacterium]